VTEDFKIIVLVAEDLAFFLFLFFSSFWRGVVCSPSFPTITTKLYVSSFVSPLVALESDSTYEYSKSNLGLISRWVYFLDIGITMKNY